MTVVDMHMMQLVLRRAQSVMVVRKDKIETESSSPPAIWGDIEGRAGGALGGRGAGPFRWSVQRQSVNGIRSVGSSKRVDEYWGRRRYGRRV
jgi:hypothetical protein